MNKSQVIILGAGRPFSGNKPSALVDVPFSKQRILDWLVDAFCELDDVVFHFIGGYRFEEIVNFYPNINFTHNPEWKLGGSVSSLLLAPLNEFCSTYICYADVVFCSDVVSALRANTADIVLCIDRKWNVRYEGRSTEDLLRAEKIALLPNGGIQLGRLIDPAIADGELVGVFRFSGRAIKAIKDSRQELIDSNFKLRDMPCLIQRLASQGLSTGVVENQGRWAELNAPQDLARFVFGTKAETLERLRPLVRLSRICEQICFDINEWRRDSTSIIAAIQKKFSTTSVVVRSSARSEDGWSASNAGAFKSVLDVTTSNIESLTDAVSRVINSYGSSDPHNQVFIQPMVQGVRISGVILTRTLNHGAPYYVINYDDTSSLTDSVTSGSSRNLRTLYVQHRNCSSVGQIDPRIAVVLEAIIEIQELVGYTFLDIEFAQDFDGVVHLLQLRPISSHNCLTSISDEHIESALAQATDWFNSSRMRGSRLVGERTLFSVMSDWNPAEIIGINPRRLAISLYQKMITDEVWAIQRSEYGYRDVRPCPLIVSFCGHPYVDLRASFNSFVPASLDDSLATRLVEHYQQRLTENPVLHDKVEFSVAFTCLTFDFEMRAREQLTPAGFSDADIDMLATSLRELTRQGIARVESDFAVILELDRRYQQLLQRNIAPLDLAFELFEDCRRFGTLPFSHLARSAFIAVSFLHSLEKIGVITPQSKNNFLASLTTVTQTFEHDGARVYAGELSRDDFIMRYGHLRPGTYDINNYAYSDDPQRYLEPMIKPRKSTNNCYKWPIEIRTRINELLQQHGLEVDVDSFERFLRRAIEGREYAKFIFSRNLSKGLAALTSFGAHYGLDREDLSFLDISDLYKLRISSPPADLVTWLKTLAEEGSVKYRLSQAIELPPLITSARDFFCFERPASEPNFVGQGRVEAALVILADGETKIRDELMGKVIVLSRADPGYDWLFAHSIGGLVTQYGGANSHMAIRAAELGLPAAIGVGNAIFERLSTARMILLDCAARKIELQA